MHLGTLQDKIRDLLHKYKKGEKRGEGPGLQVLCFCFFLLMWGQSRKELYARRVCINLTEHYQCIFPPLQIKRGPDGNYVENLTRIEVLRMMWTHSGGGSLSFLPCRAVTSLTIWLEPYCTSLRFTVHAQVSSREQLEKYWAFGMKNRSTASTKMNDQSSRRSHSVYWWCGLL